MALGMAGYITAYRKKKTNHNKKTCLLQKNKDKNQNVFH